MGIVRKGWLASALLLLGSMAWAQGYTGGQIIISDTNFILRDSTTATKRMFFELSGLSTGVNVFTVPNLSNSAAGTATLAYDGTNETSLTTVTVQGKAYRFISTAVVQEGDILIGASSDATMTNFSRAINNSGGTAGTDYLVAAANPYVSSAIDTTGTGGTVTLTASINGTRGNAYTVATTEAHITATDFATLATGVNGSATLSTTASGMQNGQTPINVGVVGTNDRIIISAAVKGAGQFDGTITSADLTGARTWTLPNQTGNFVALGQANLSLLPTAPTAAAASGAGYDSALAASNATAGTSSAGAAAGGAVTLTGGDAARYTSGDANGGSINFVPGAGIGAGTRGTVNFGSAAVYDRILVSPAVKGAGQFDGTLTSSDLTATATWTFPDASGTFALLGVSNGSTLSSGSIIAGDTSTYDRIVMNPVAKGASQFDLTLSLLDQDAAHAINFPNASGTVLVANPTLQAVTTAGASTITAITLGGATPLVLDGATAGTNATSLTVVDPTGANTITVPDASGTIQLASAKSLYTLIQGGYTLSGTTTASPADTVKITIVDTVNSITDGDVQVCGYTTAGDQSTLVKTCEIIDCAAMGGGGNATTSATFIEITNIKASSFATLNGTGDETIKAEFTGGGSPVAIFTAVNLVNSAKSNFVNVTVKESLWSPVCIDLQGCDVEPADLTSASNGRVLTIIGRDSTQTITLTDSANMDIAAAGAAALTVGDSIQLIYNSVNAKAWVEISRSAND